MKTHGKPSTYASGCRCSECRAGKSAYQAEFRRGRYVAPESPDALTGGRWVPVDGIVRWRSDSTINQSKEAS